VQNRARGGSVLTTTNFVLTFGVVTSVPLLAKVDQEMRSWECTQIDTRTETNRIYNLSHPICYNYGANKKRRTVFEYRKQYSSIYLIFEYSISALILQITIVVQVKQSVDSVYEV